MVKYRPLIEGSSVRRNTLLGLFALLLLICIAYRPVLNGGSGFIWDDDRHVSTTPPSTIPRPRQRIWTWGPHFPLRPLRQTRHPAVLPRHLHLLLGRIPPLAEQPLRLPRHQRRPPPPGANLLLWRLLTLPRPLRRNLLLCRRPLRRAPRQRRIRRLDLRAQKHPLAGFLPPRRPRLDPLVKSVEPHQGLSTKHQPLQ